MSVDRISRENTHHITKRTVQLLIHNVQFGIGVIENLVDLDIESIMLLGHRLDRVLLVDSASYQ